MSLPRGHVERHKDEQPNKVMLRVPAVLGHEEEQAFLERSDMPAAAWPSRVYRAGGKLKADFDKIPPKTRRLLQSHAYRTVSSEIYDEPPEGIPGKGKMLRRIAFLGGDIPQVKNLDEILELTEGDDGPLRGVDIFSVGTHRGKTYTARDLDDIVRNFDRFSRDRNSPEIHGDGCNAFGERFDRGEFFTVQFSHAIQLAGAPGCWACFSEVVPMDRDALIQKLQSLGVDTGTITDAVPDELLQEMCRLADSARGQKNMDDDPAGQGAAAGSGGSGGSGVEVGPFAKKPDEMDDGMAGLPEAVDDDQKQRFAELGRHLVKKYGACRYDDMPEPEGDEQRQKFAEFGGRMLKKYADETPADEKPGDASEYAEMYSALRKYAGFDETPDEKPEGDEPMKHSEIQAVVEKAVADALKGQVGGTLAELQKFNEETVAAEKKRAVESFVERMRKEGRVTPAELQEVPGKPSLLRRLLRADSRRAVEKFTEKGRTVELTELDLQMREIEARPTLFGERFRDPAAARGAPDAEAAKVERFSESPRFAEALKACGKKPADFVNEFKELQKKRPDITAVEYGVPEHAA
jgi:hypothetical protein